MTASATPSRPSSPARPRKGTFVRIEAPMVEGRVVRGFEALDVGDALRVRLVAVDAERGYIDFESA